MKSSPFAKQLMLIRNLKKFSISLQFESQPRLKSDLNVVRHAQSVYGYPISYRISIHTKVCDIFMYKNDKKIKNLKSK